MVTTEYTKYTEKTFCFSVYSVYSVIKILFFVLLILTGERLPQSGCADARYVKRGRAAALQMQLPCSGRYRPRI